MISHPGRTGSCIMPPRRAVSCLLKLNPPARIGKNEAVPDLLTSTPSLHGEPRSGSSRSSRGVHGGAVGFSSWGLAAKLPGSRNLCFTYVSMVFSLCPKGSAAAGAPPPRMPAGGRLRWPSATTYVRQCLADGDVVPYPCPTGSLMFGT